MRRILTILVAGILMTGLAPNAMAVQVRSPRKWRQTECRFQYNDNHRHWSQDEVKKTITCFAAKFNVSRTYAFYVANRESHFGQFATNPSSGACGVFQHIPTYFPTRLRSVAHHRSKFKPFGQSCYNARDNVAAALWVVHQGGWGPWGG